MMLAGITVQIKGYISFLLKGVIVLIVLFIVSPCNSQNYTCQEILSSSEGLSQSTINCLLQDKDGFLWIGTQDGLNVYDGYHFTYYQNIPSDSTSLLNNYVLSLCEDRDGQIWVGTMSAGLGCLNKKTGRFQNYIHHPDDSLGISDNSIWCLTVDQKGNILAGTNAGINEFNKDTQCFNHYMIHKDDTTGLPSNMILSLLTDKTNLIWVGTNNGLAFLDIDTKTITAIPSGQPDNEYIIWSMANKSKDLLLLGTKDGVCEFNKDKHQYKRLWTENTNIPSTVWFILPDNGRYWIGTRRGIRMMNPEFSICSEFDYGQVNSLNSDNENIWCFHKDQSGTVWAGSDRGIVKIVQSPNTFKLLDNNPEKDQHISGLSVNSILVDSDKTLWIGTDGQGLNKLANGEKEFKVYTSNKSNQESLSGNRVWALIEDRDGIIWVGTYGRGLCSFDKNTEIFTSYLQNRQKENWISNNRILALLEGHNGDIWIGTRGGGLNRYDKKKGTFEVFKNDPNDPNSLSSNTIISICEDLEGNLWIGTYEGGLCLFDSEKNAFTTFKNDLLNSNSISNNNVWSILFDEENRMWLGTEGGLNVSENPGISATFKHFTTSQGLASNGVFGLEIDDQSNIWMSSFKGISKLQNSVLNNILHQDKDLSEITFDPFNPLFKNYDKSFGLQGNEFNQGAYFKADNGMIYFGGLEGLTYFNPNDVKESDFVPQIVLTNFKIFNKEVSVFPSSNYHETKDKEIIKVNETYFIPSKITWLNELVLSYRESVFSFDFASLDYTNPNKNQYAYLMEGFDKDWNFVANQTSATYTNLDPGEYIFRVKGTNAEGIWSPNEAQIKLLITPPFWETKWFIFLIILISVIILVYTIRRILQHQKRKAIAEREKIELQLKTIKNQIDPHFAFNAMNMVGSLVYKGDPDTVYDYFTRFARLIRSTLQDSEKIARPLEDELEFVKNYIEIQKTRFKDKFNFDLTVDDNTDLTIEVPKMIIQTHAENALKHGLMHRKENGLLTIAIHQQNKRLSIEIKDNGIGRKKAAEVSKGSTGKGMQIIQQIFTLYNKLFGYKIEQEVIDLTDDNGEAAGTKVVMTIDL